MLEENASLKGAILSNMGSQQPFQMNVQSLGAPAISTQLDFAGQFAHPGFDNPLFLVPEQLPLPTGPLFAQEKKSVTGVLPAPEVIIR